MRRFQPIAFVVLLGLLIGCQTPVGVKRIDARSVHLHLTGNAISADVASLGTLNVLRKHGLLEQYDEMAEETLARLHGIFLAEGELTEALALAELSFLQGEKKHSRAHYLASAVYAYAFLFSKPTDLPVSPYDPKLRLACDLYNRGITSGFASQDGGEVELRSGTYELPFGRLEVVFPDRYLTVGNRKLVHFLPVAELDVRGLRNRYRQPGIGAPLAAAQQILKEEVALQVAPRIKVPVTAILRIENPTQQLRQGHIHSMLELYSPADSEVVHLQGRDVPLEMESTAALAAGLSDPGVWEFELSAFLGGDVFKDKPSQLVSLEPYRSGRIPVVFVHGTASSPGRWAEMLNDLTGDRRIRERYQFWFFFYDSGNPIAYSAMLLRDALSAAAQKVDPTGQERALQNMVVIGHSQGGLLTKFLAVDPGDRLWTSMSNKPLEEVDVPEEMSGLLRRTLFVTPSPTVRRVVFIATPHRGSFFSASWLANKVASFVRLPATLGKNLGDFLLQNKTILTVDPDKYFGTSVFAMKPGSPVITELSKVPVVPDVKAHSIIAVKGEGPVEEGDDGIVTYRSAHLDGVESEFVIRSGHSCQGEPGTIEEVRRILLLHASESCGHAVGCG